MSYCVVCMETNINVVSGCDYCVITLCISCDKIVHDTYTHCIHCKHRYYMSPYDFIYNGVGCITDFDIQEICQTQNLPVPFMEKYKDQLNWTFLSYYQDFSEEFMNKYHDYIDWYWVSSLQNMSKDFIILHQDKIVWNELQYNPYILEEDFCRLFSKLYLSQQQKEIIDLTFLTDY